MDRSRFDTHYGCPPVDVHHGFRSEQDALVRISVHIRIRTRLCKLHRDDLGPESHIDREHGDDDIGR